MKQIVIPTDGSPSACEAVATGIELAVEQGAEITFVHVTPPVEFAGGRYAAWRPLSHHVAVEEGETVLGEAGEAAERAGVSYGLEKISGPVVKEIVTVAEAKGADLIVMGSRGRGELSSALLGSVSRGVLQAAFCPVLVVKTAPVPAAV